MKIVWFMEFIDGYTLETDDPWSHELLWYDDFLSACGNVRVKEGL